MKKTFKILFRIFYITLFLAILLVVIYAFLSKVWGTATVQIEGEPYVPENISGFYELGEELNINCRQTEDRMKFTHVKGNYGMYDYVIPIRTETIDTELTIHFLKTNQLTIDTLDIKVELYETAGIWNADVIIEIDGRLTEASFYDIEENAIEIRVE